MMVPLAAQIEKVQREIRYAQEDHAARAERLWSAVLASLQQHEPAMAVVGAARRARKSLRLLIKELSDPGAEAARCRMGIRSCAGRPGRARQGRRDMRQMPRQPPVEIVPIQIRRDLTVQIAGIPHDLTREEAEKIARIVMAMVADDSECFRVSSEVARPVRRELRRRRSPQ